MHRHLLKLVLSLPLFVYPLATALAEEAAAAPAGDGWSGPGFYLSWIKIASFWILFLIWVRTADWVNRDLEDVDLDYLHWNPIVTAPFFIAFLLSWVLPWYWASLALLFLTLVVPTTIYIIVRNKTVADSEKVFTPGHFRRLMSGKKEEPLSPHEMGPPLTLEAVATNTQEKNLKEIPARQHPGFLPARRIIADTLSRRGEIITMDMTANGITMRIMVDGVWFQSEPPPPEESFAAVDAMRILCGLNPQDRINRQQGQFLAKYQKTKLKGSFFSQGNPNMQRVYIKLEMDKCPFKTLDHLGMRQPLQERLRAQLAAEKGMFIFSAPDAAGLRTTCTVALNAADRYMREYLAIEEQSRRYEEIENVPPYVFNGANPDEIKEILRKVVHMDPNVIVFRDIPNGEILQLLAREAKDDNRLILTSTRAVDTAQAVMNLRGLQPVAEGFPEVLNGAICQRLVRRLCDQCKQAYPPQPQVLQQLGIPPGRVQAFYQPGQPNPDNPKEVCQQCGGIGYFGRIAVFEYLEMNDNLRQVLQQGADYQTFRNACIQSGMIPMQKEGVLLVASGVTSLQELTRVLQGR